MCIILVLDRTVPRGSLTANQLISWTNATQLKLFDKNIALKADEDSASMLSRAIGLAKLSQDNSFQMSQNRLIWKQNRAVCRERLAAQRAQQAREPVHDVSRVTPRSYPLKNARGGANTDKKCTICGQVKRGTHSRLLNDCPSLGFTTK